jgi:hypothetical protein
MSGLPQRGQAFPRRAVPNLELLPEIDMERWLVQRHPDFNGESGSFRVVHDDSTLQNW